MLVVFCSTDPLSSGVALSLTGNVKVLWPPVPCTVNTLLHKPSPQVGCVLFLTATCTRVATNRVLHEPYAFGQLAV